MKENNASTSRRSNVTEHRFGQPAPGSPSGEFDPNTNYTISTCRVKFRDCTETIEDVFGNTPLSLPQMQERLWDFVKKKDLMYLVEDN